MKNSEKLSNKNTNTKTNVWKIFFTKEDVWMANKYIKRWAPSLAIKKNVN